MAPAAVAPAAVAPAAEAPATAAVSASAVPVAAAGSAVLTTASGTGENDLQMLQRRLTLTDSLGVQRPDLDTGQR